MKTAFWIAGVLCVALAGCGDDKGAAGTGGAGTGGAGGMTGGGGGAGAGGAAACASPGGAVTGAADAHCTMTVTINQASCGGAGGAGGMGGHDHGMAGMGGAGAGGEMGGEMYPPTMSNAEGDDDDCKYHLKWTSTAVCQNSDVFFTVTLTKKKDGMAAGGGKTSAEVYLDEMHPAPNSNQMTTETSPGVYKVGPIRFDKAGKWTVRFHTFEECADAEDSPHGHAAFYVNVP